MSQPPTYFWPNRRGKVSRSSRHQTGTSFGQYRPSKPGFSLPKTGIFLGRRRCPKVRLKNRRFAMGLHELNRLICDTKTAPSSQSKSWAHLAHISQILTRERFGCSERRIFGPFQGANRLTIPFHQGPDSGFKMQKRACDSHWRRCGTLSQNGYGDQYSRMFA